MVERIMRDPERAPIPESALAPPPLERQGLCLICGMWIDDEQRDEVYAVTLEHAGEVSEHVAHRVCLAGVAHESAGLSGRGPAGAPDAVPDNHLSAKFRTPSGR